MNTLTYSGFDRNSRGARAPVSELRHFHYFLEHTTHPSLHLHSFIAVVNNHRQLKVSLYPQSKPLARTLMVALSRDPAMAGESHDLMGSSPPQVDSFGAVSNGHQRQMTSSALNGNNHRMHDAQRPVPRGPHGLMNGTHNRGHGSRNIFDGPRSPPTKSMRLSCHEILRLMFIIRHESCSLQVLCARPVSSWSHLSIHAHLRTVGRRVQIFQAG